MKKRLCLIFGFLLIWNLPMIPNHRIAVGDLEPVEVIFFQKSENTITAKTDTGSFGQGINFSEALENLKMNALGEIFLDTVDNIIVQNTCVNYICDIKNEFRPATRVYLAEVIDDLEQTAQYLRTHTGEVSISEYLAGEKQIPNFRMD